MIFILISNVVIYYDFTDFRNTKCNTLRGVTEGMLFPPYMDPRASFRLYRKLFCRAFPITFVKEVEESGVPEYLYKISDDFADPENPDNECYCRDKECLKKGLIDLTPCYYGDYTPMFIISNITAKFNTYSIFIFRYTISSFIASLF